MNIDITIRDKVAVAPEGATIVCGNSDYTITFDFDAEWDAEPNRVARFAWEGSHKDVEFTGNSVAVPILSGVYSVSVGVYAGYLHTTTPARIACRPSILCGDTAMDNTDPVVWQKLQEQIDEITGEEENLSLLIETDMLPAVHDNGKILTDEAGRIVLRY